MCIAWPIVESKSIYQVIVSQTYIVIAISCDLRVGRWLTGAIAALADAVEFTNPWFSHRFAKELLRAHCSDLKYCYQMQD